MFGTAWNRVRKAVIADGHVSGAGIATGPALVLGLLFVALWFYRSNTSPWGAVFIGEDFPVFWWQAYIDPLGSLAKPYAGYLHLVPRLAGSLAALTPNIGAPLVFVLVYASSLYLLVVGLLSATRRLGLLVLGALLIAPNTGEVFASITYFQWVSGPLLVALYLGDLPRRWPGRVFYGAALLVAGLSGPFSALLAPFAAFELLWLWRAGRLGEARSRTVVCSAVIGCGLVSVLAYVIAGSDQIAHGDTQHYATLASDAFRQIFSVLGQGGMVPTDWRALLVAITLGVCLLSRPCRWQKVVLIGFSALVVLAAIHKFRFDAAAFAQPQFGTRYFFVAIVSILVIFALTLWNNTAARWAVVACVLVIAASYNYRGWRGAERIAVDWHAQRNGIQADRWVSVFVNPFWNFVVARGEQGQQLYWVDGTVQPEASSSPSVVPLEPGSRIQVSGAVNADSTCGFVVPVVSNPGAAVADGSLLVRVKAQSARGGAPAQEAFKVQVSGLQDWSTFTVGTGIMGPQQVDIQIEPVADRPMHIGLPAQENAGQARGLVVESGRAFPGVLWSIECTTASPFGELELKPVP